MKKSYITIESLPEIVSDLMEDFGGRSDCRLLIRIGSQDGSSVLHVSVSKTAGEGVFNGTYHIIDEPRDSFGIRESVERVIKERKEAQS